MIAAAVDRFEVSKASWPNRAATPAAFQGNCCRTRVWMIWQRDHLVRRIYLTDKHSPNLKLSWFGESIGRYEGGDTLVVDTIGLSTRNSYIDNWRTPHSEQLHVIERFKLSTDRISLEALALQLPFCLEVRALSDRLVSSTPERPCDDMCGLDSRSSESDGDAADFLD
jgi:hypothetical protein